MAYTEEMDLRQNLINAFMLTVEKNGIFTKEEIEIPKFKEIRTVWRVDEDTKIVSGTIAVPAVTLSMNYNIENSEDVLLALEIEYDNATVEYNLEVTNVEGVTPSAQVIIVAPSGAKEVKKITAITSGEKKPYTTFCKMVKGWCY